jgi:hypothetical protein
MSIMIMNTMFELASHCSYDATGKYLSVCLSHIYSTSTQRCSEIRSACNQIVCVIAAYCHDENAFAQNEDAVITVFTAQRCCVSCYIVHKD